MSGWVAGWNMTSYMPDPEHVWVTEMYDDAVAYIKDAIQRHGDHAYDADMADEVQEADYALERLDEALVEANFYESVGYTSYWIEWSDEASPEDEES